MRIPITKPYFDEKEIGAVVDVLRSGWVVQGPKVAEFEKRFSELQGCSHAIAVNSATSALHLALVVLDVKEGDEVILPAFTYPATANVVVHLRATPIFVDVDLSTFNVDPNEVLKKISSKTKAIISVHLFGLPADMDKLLKHGIPVVEDAACAMGAEYKGRKVGTIGICGAFSFHPRKPITTGEGGMFTTNDGEIANSVRALRSHGETIPDKERHDSEGIIYPEYKFAGYNYRMTDIQAAIGVEQIKKFSFIVEERKRIAEKYSLLLADLESKELINLPTVPAGSVHTYQSYVIVMKNGLSRDKLSIKLQQKGIATRKGTYNVPLTTFYRERYGFKTGDFPNSEFLEENSLALPLYVGMTDEEIDYVVTHIRRFLT